MNPGKYRIKLCGARGGHMHGLRPYTGNGGSGGCSEGTITMKKKEELFLYIGGHGKDIAGYYWTVHEGGYNGGGWGSDGACSGGGGTDIRLRKSQDDPGLRSRIMVAGGGGGANDYLDGGSGGGFKGQNGNQEEGESIQDVGIGGNQTSPGLSPFPGIFGQGGSIDATEANRYSDGGGGGGGYFGGARGKWFFATGGGGSGYVSGLDGCVAVLDEEPLKSASNSIHYSGMVFSDASMKGSNYDDGFAEITYLDDIETKCFKMEPMTVASIACFLLLGVS